MSTEQITSAPAVPVAKHAPIHPLSPLTKVEITRASALIRGLYPARTDLQFKVITLDEPEKAQLVPFLEAEHNGSYLPSIERKAFVNYYIRNTVCSMSQSCHSIPILFLDLVPADHLRQDKFHEAVVNLSQQRIESHFRLGPNIHSPGDGEEILLVEKAALEDEGVKAEIAKLQLPEGATIISDPWIYGRTYRLLLLRYLLTLVRI